MYRNIFYYFAEDRWVFNMIKYLGQKWAGEVFPLAAPLCSAWPEIITPKGRKYLINRSILFLILTIQWLCLFYFRWSKLYCTVEFSSQTNINGFRGVFISFFVPRPNSLKSFLHRPFRPNYIFLYRPFRPKYIFFLSHLGQTAISSRS